MTIEEKRKQIVKNIVKRLKNDGRGSAHVQKILTDPDFKLWLDTWVIFPLEMATAELPAGDYRAREDFEAGLNLSGR